MEDQKDKVIKYFGHGTNRDHDMMAAIIGRNNIAGEPGKLLGYELGIQKIENMREKIPENSPIKKPPCDIVKDFQGTNFEMYVVRPNSDAVTHGMIWDVTPDEFEILSDWEAVDCGVQENIETIAINNKGEKISIITHGLLNHPRDVDRIVEGKDYEAYIISRDQMLSSAEVLRKDFLRRKKEVEK